jgi:hypothetical protein
MTLGFCPRSWGYRTSQHAADYEAIIAAVKGQSVKAKQLAAQLIPRFFRSFPALATRAMEAMFDLVEMEELPVRSVLLLSICSNYATFMDTLSG